MKRLLILAVAAAALSGCAHQITPAQAGALITTLHNAGCGGSVDVDVRGGSGQLGGSASGAFTLHGTCPTAPTPVTDPAG